MIDINLLRNNPDLVRENIKKKFQDKKLPLVDEVLELDRKKRELQKEGDERRAKRNTLSATIGKLMKEKRTGCPVRSNYNIEEINIRSILLPRTLSVSLRRALSSSTIRSR